MKKANKGPGTKRIHTAAGQKGSGDFYGTGIRNPVGKMRSDSVGRVRATKKQLNTPPKSLA